MYVNSLFALRVLNIFLVIWLISEICNRLSSDKAWQSFWGVKVADKNETELTWDNVDIRIPPPLNDTDLEALRLNEYLAKPQYSCSDKQLVGGPSDNFLLCYDSKFLVEPYFFGKTLIVTGLSNAPAVFESDHNTTRWDVFMPPDSPIMEEFRQDVEISYMPEVTEEEYFPMEMVFDGIKPNTYSVAKLELYSDHFNDDQHLKAPGLIRQVLEHLRTDQLLIQIRIEPTNATQVASLWTRLLYDIFFKHSYALLGAHSNSACQRPLGHCIYRATFVKASIDEVAEAPVWGLGSPGEERNRLIKYYKDLGDISSCKKAIGRRDVPVLCADDEEFEDCSILYFRYRSLLQSDVHGLQNTFGGCSVSVHYPEPASFETSDKVKIIPTGILSRTQPSNIVAGMTPDTQWQLKTFTDILTSFEATANRKKYLMFDLDGDDVEVMPSIVSDCLALKKYRQIAFRVRVFYGEENKSYRNAYLRYLQFEQCGFSKIYSLHPEASTFFIIFKGFV